MARSPMTRATTLVSRSKYIRLPSNLTAHCQAMNLLTVRYSLEISLRPCRSDVFIYLVESMT